MRIRSFISQSSAPGTWADPATATAAAAEDRARAAVAARHVTGDHRYDNDLVEVETGGDFGPGRVGGAGLHRDRLRRSIDKNLDGASGGGGVHRARRHCQHVDDLVDHDRGGCRYAGLDG